MTQSIDQAAKELIQFARDYGLRAFALDETHVGAARIDACPAKTAIVEVGSPLARQAIIQLAGAP